MTRAPSKRPGGALRKAWPIYRLESDIDDRLEITGNRERVEMVQDPHTDEWWYRHTHTTWVFVKGRTVVNGMGPWIKPLHPVAFGHTPGPRARRVRGRYALLPPLPEAALALHMGAIKGRAKAYKAAWRKAERAEAHESRKVAPIKALGYFDANDNYIPFEKS